MEFSTLSQVSSSPSRVNSTSAVPRDVTCVAHPHSRTRTLLGWDYDYKSTPTSSISPASDYYRSTIPSSVAYTPALDAMSPGSGTLTGYTSDDNQQQTPLMGRGTRGFKSSVSSPKSRPDQSSSPPSSPPPTVTFTTCPRCNTVEHHFIQQSQVCGRCGFERKFTVSPTSFSMLPSSSRSRTWWRPTMYTRKIVYAHVREGYEGLDDPIHHMLATWADSQSSNLFQMASQVASNYYGDPSIKAYYLELAPNPTMYDQLAAISQSSYSVSSLEADDALGVFTVLKEEHALAKSRGGRGIVLMVLSMQGTQLAIAHRLDEPMS